MQTAHFQAGAPTLRAFAPDLLQRLCGGLADFPVLILGGQLEGIHGALIADLAQRLTGVDTGRNLLSSLGRLPLRLGRVDFSPLAGLVLVLVVVELAEWGLRKLYPLLPY